MCKCYEHAIVITNRALVNGDFLEQLQKVAQVHPHALILREKDLPDTEYEKLAAKVLEIYKTAGVPVFLHSRMEIAARLGCENIHLSIPVLQDLSDVWRDALTTNFKEISVSCHSMEDVELAVKSGATQIVLGTIFETQCKPGKMGAGLSFLKEVCRAAHTVNPTVKVFAIGGIKPDNIKKVLESGADGGCMMSWFMQQD